MSEQHTQGQRLIHKNRGACTFIEKDSADPSGATAWVRFDDDEECMVSTELLRQRQPTPEAEEEATLRRYEAALNAIEEMYHADRCPVYQYSGGKCNCYVGIARAAIAEPTTTTPDNPRSNYDEVRDRL
jgi:hypothetical protein